MYINTHTYIFIYTHRYIYRYVCTYIHTYIYKYMCKYMMTCTQSRTETHLHINAFIHSLNLSQSARNQQKIEIIMRQQLIFEPQMEEKRPSTRQGAVVSGKGEWRESMRAERKCEYRERKRRVLI